MNWNKHSELDGKHAFLSPSKYHWINYDEDKLAESFMNHLAVERGTQLHEYAAMAISLGRKQPKNNQTVNMYINDALAYKMMPEQKLYYSKYCFGTADAIMFRNNKLRIHDLKTGVTPAHMEQLEVYAALFCLENNIKPSTIEIELRIYQNNEVQIYNPTVEDIVPIMDKIKTFSKLLDKLEREEY